MNPHKPSYRNILTPTGDSVNRLRDFLETAPTAVLDLNKIVAEPAWFKEIEGLTYTDFALYYYLTNRLSVDLKETQINRYFNDTDTPFKFEYSAQRLHTGALTLLSEQCAEELFRKGAHVARMVDEFNVTTLSAWRMKYWGCCKDSAETQDDAVSITFNTLFSPPIAAMRTLAQQLSLSMRCLFVCNRTNFFTEVIFENGVESKNAFHTS